MPSLEDLLEAEGPYVVGELDNKRYCKMSIIVEFTPETYEVTPLCMADDWEKSWPARLIAEQDAHKHTCQELTSTAQRASVFEHDFKMALERANRVAWLESEVSRLTADLERFRQQEAAQRLTDQRDLSIGAYEVQHQRDADMATPPLCSLTGAVVSSPTGVCQCSWCVKVRAKGMLKADGVRGTDYRDGEVAANYDGNRWNEINPPLHIYTKGELDNQRANDAHFRCAVTGIAYADEPCKCQHCTNARGAYQAVDRLNRPVTNSHIANDAPIFRKLCQCDDCRELRAASGYQTTEIEGH